MKKFFALGLLTLAAASLATERASAWWPCFPLSCSGNSCTTTIRLRQYNAFTPICCGTLTCDGCCPISGPGCMPGACGPALMCMNGGMGGMGGMGGAACYDAYGMGQLPAPAAVTNMMPAAPMAAPAAQTPVPMQNGQPVGVARPYYYYRPLTPHQPVQPVAYQAMYNPAAYMPMMPVQTPWYWAPGGR